jgi:Sec-independent protein secretion pathway component TatC
MNTTVNKANVAGLIAIISPMIIWGIMRMIGAGLTEAETAMFNAGIGGVLGWIGVYFTDNAGA